MASLSYCVLIEDKNYNSFQLDDYPLEWDKEDLPDTEEARRLVRE